MLVKKILVVKSLQVPDGYVTGHANQARITTFPQDDSTTCLFSADVISFAREIGLYDGTDAEFSFSDVYDPVTFSGARFCEARVWSFFTAVMVNPLKPLTYNPITV